MVEFEILKAFDKCKTLSQVRETRRLLTETVQESAQQTIDRLTDINRCPSKEDSELVEFIKEELKNEAELIEHNVNIPSALSPEDIVSLREEIEKQIHDDPDL